MLLLGKVTWGVAIALAVGMGIISGAKDLVVVYRQGAVQKGFALSAVNKKALRIFAILRAFYTATIFNKL
ncbi:MAG: Transporter [Candidatus Midichloria mitochondrii]|nr:hypothetical protein [Candidatus Midichloria mitochondrii]